jgi:hypothetical protein
MSINAFISSYLTKDYHTESSGTAIDESVAGQNGKRLALVGVDYLCGSTAHNLVIMHSGILSGSRTTASAAAAASQKDVICTDTPVSPAGDAVASGDIIAYQVTGGGWEFNTVASLSTKTITLTNNIAVIIPILAKIRIFGIIADGANFVIGLTASVVTHHDDTILAQAPFVGDPLYVSNANATAASFQNYLLFAYINK